jgi:hypothetical protein
MFKGKYKLYKYCKKLCVKIQRILFYIYIYRNTLSKSEWVWEPLVQARVPQQSQEVEVRQDTRCRKSEIILMQHFQTAYKFFFNFISMQA